MRIVGSYLPSAFLPFAGAYVIGGAQAFKNEFLGTTSWDVCAKEVLARRPGETVCLLREGDTLDLPSLTSDKTYEPINAKDQVKYIKSTL